MKQLERRKKTLANQVLNLEGKASQINQLCVELVKSIGICEGLDELLSDLLGDLEFTVMSDVVFEAELIKVRKAICFLCGQTGNIQEKLESAAPQTVEIGLQFEWLQAGNKHLSAIKTHLGNELAIIRHQRIISRTDYGYNCLY